MISDMRFHHSAALSELDRGTDADLAKVAASLTAARTAAKDAAPYLHPRLAAIEHMGQGGGPIRITSNAREQLAHLIAVELAELDRDGIAIVSGRGSKPGERRDGRQKGRQIGGIGTAKLADRRAAGGNEVRAKITDALLRLREDLARSAIPPDHLGQSNASRAELL